VINKTLPFHASQFYQIQAPPPFENDVHENIAASLARISQQEYQSEFDMHIDLQNSFAQLRDGHTVWINECYVRLTTLCTFPYSHTASPGWYALRTTFLTSFVDLTCFFNFIALWVNYVPAPLVLLAEENDTQAIYISKSAFNISGAMFGDDLQFWQDALPGNLSGRLDLVRPKLDLSLVLLACPM